MPVEIDREALINNVINFLPKDYYNLNYKKHCQELNGEILSKIRLVTKTGNRNNPGTLGLFFLCKFIKIKFIILVNFEFLKDDIITHIRIMEDFTGERQRMSLDCLEMTGYKAFSFYDNKIEFIGFEYITIKNIFSHNCNFSVENKVLKFSKMSGLQIIKILNKLQKILNIYSYDLIDISIIFLKSGLGISLTRLSIFKYGKTWYERHIKGNIKQPIIKSLINATKKITIKEYFENIRNIPEYNRDNEIPTREIMKKLNFKTSDTITSFILKVINKDTTNITEKQKVDLFVYFTDDYGISYVSILDNGPSIICKLLGSK